MIKISMIFFNRKIRFGTWEEVTPHDCLESGYRRTTKNSLSLDRVYEVDTAVPNAKRESTKRAVDDNIGTT